MSASVTPSSPIMRIRPEQRPAQCPAHPRRPGTSENLCSPAERLENMRSVDAIPDDVLPHCSRAWFAVLALAGVSLDVYAYQSTSGWNLWLGPLGRRVTVAAFCARTTQVLQEMGADAHLARFLVAGLEAAGTWDADGRVRVPQPGVGRESRP